MQISTEEKNDKSRKPTANCAKCSSDTKYVSSGFMQTEVNLEHDNPTKHPKDNYSHL